MSPRTQSKKSGIEGRADASDADRAGESSGEIAALFCVVFFVLFEVLDREVELAFFPTVFSFTGALGTALNSPG